MSTATDTNGKHAPAARLCHVMKWDNFDGYGFNLHAEKGKPGQYIGKVDKQSPAEAAGLRQGDKILEVNGVPIGDKTHKQVVELIKSRTNDTTMVVVDPILTTISAPAAEHSSSKNGNGQATVNTVSEHTNNQANGNGNSIINNVLPEKIGATTMGENGVDRTTDGNTGMLNLKNMTAAELRANLANRKKYDPKKEMMDFKKKFDIVQKL